MREVVVVDVVRTPIGKHRGALKTARPDDLAALVIRSLLERNPIDAALVEDVILGCTNQAGEDNRNVARMAGLLAGLPLSVGGVTVNRLCASGLEAMHQAVHCIMIGEGDIFIAGGVESMTRSPLVLQKPEKAYVRGTQTLWDTTLGWRMVNPKLAQMHHPFSMGETAENVAERYQISREAQDEFALRSQHNAEKAIVDGRLAEEIIPVPASFIGGSEDFVADEHPRAGLRAEQLQKLRPLFRADGTVTAGNSSGINDGAAAALVMARDKAEHYGFQPILKYVASAVAGVDPAYMGIGPVPATKKALSRAGLSVGDLSVVEINEAFAAQTLACVQELGIPIERVNPNGGAIALGHPLGCSGTRLVGTLARELKRSRGRYGLTTLCVGVGQGVASIWENLSFSEDGGITGQ